MLFNSFEFLIFFPIVTVIYFLLPYKFRWVHLLAASCIFYMAFVPIYILILFTTIIIDYIAGIMIENAAGNRKKLFLIISIVANVGMLAYFKYYNFFADNINILFSYTHTKANIPLLNIILPLGLSFHTFQAMSYTIEVYLENQKAERHLGIYALYVMFYPQLVAGPIERPQNMIHQFHERHKLEYDNITYGLRLMLWGLFKKLVIADRLSHVVDIVFDNPHQNSGTSLIIGTVFFAFQMYCDFSGYSDIAIGAARVMGYKLMQNFDRPFNSRSLTEFWRRWHISLSTWLYEYIFNPIMFRFRGRAKQGIIIGFLVTFLLSGFWHGAGWKFLLCGLFQGLGLIYEYLTKKPRKRIFDMLPKWIADNLSRCFVFCYMAFTWIFFRANTTDDALYIVTKIAHVPIEFAKGLYHRAYASLNITNLHNRIMPCVTLIVFLELAQLVHAKYHVDETFGKLPVLIRWSIYFSAMGVLLCFGIHPIHQFIYFQF